MNAPLWLLGIANSDEPLWDNDNFRVEIAGVYRSNRLVSDTLRWTEYEGGQTSALSLEVEDVDNSLTVSEWQEVKVGLGATVLWGGYIVRAQPAMTPGGNRRWLLRCESYDTLLNRTPIVRKTYVDQDPGSIVADLFVQAGLSEFDTASLVDGSLPALETFVARGEKFTDLLDRLALLARVSWAINERKQVIFKQDDDLPAAPFAVKALGLADLATSFPPSGSPTPDIDATDIRNRVTVYGGQVPSSIHSEAFTGDGTTTRFTLEHSPIHEIVLVTVDGVLQWHGYDYYDSQFNDYDCLVDYTLGTVRWLDPPAGGAEVEVQYRYKQQLVTTRQSDASYALYGRWFDFELRDASLTTEPACIAAGDAILAEYALPARGAALDVEWFGLRAGQRVEIEMPTLGLSGFYVIRQATIELARSTKRALVSLKVGGRSARLSRVIGGERGSGSMIGPGAGMPVQPNPSLSGEIDLLRVRDRIELIDRNTVFVSPNDYGDATGLVLLFDAVAQQGRLLGLDGGVLQAYFDNDGTIKWDAGAGVLDSAGASIGNSVFGAAGIQLQNNYGNPRAYIGDGGENFFLFDGADAQFGGLIYAAGGHFSGSVYVGTANPRIHIDGVNKRIESTNFASGTSGFRIEGATGNAEFNNITARGAIASAVFTYNQIQATAGEIVVAKGAGKLRADFTAIGASGTMTIDDPPGISHAAAGGLWSVNDIIRMKDPGVGDSWFKVLSVTDQITHWSLLVQWQAGNTLVVFKAATAVINYGQYGQGIVRISAAGSFTPYVSLATHAGSPWSLLTEKARLGNLDGVSGASGYGLWTDNGFFTGAVQATVGLIGGWTIASDNLSASDAGMSPTNYPFYAGSDKPEIAPFRVTPTGELTASNAIITGAVTATSGTFTGSVYASSGTIGNWTINSAYIARDTGVNNTSSGMAPSDFPFYAGSTYANRSSAPFRVDPAGGLYATAGSVGGFTISYIEGLYAGSGATRVQVKPGAGFWAGATARDSAPFQVTNAGALTATNATITGTITAAAGFITGQLTMDGGGSISDGTRWRLNSNGLVIASNYTDALQFRDTLGGTQRMTVGYSSGYAQVTAYSADLALVAGTVNTNVIVSAPGTGEIRAVGRMAHTGDRVGFFGVTPVSRPAAYTFTNGTVDRAINCDSTTIGELADMVYTMWSDLRSLGLLQ